MRFIPALALLGLTAATATVVLRLDIEQLVGGAETVVHGRVVRSWPGWDEGRTTIWTHYEVEAYSVWKGRTGASVVISEPGGEIDGVRMSIPGAPRYRVGEEVVIFAARTPIGYLRTHGWDQGRFRVEEAAGAASGKRVRTVLGSVVLADSPKSSRRVGASTAALDGRDLAEFRRLVESLAASGIDAAPLAEESPRGER